jgi:hydroxymethylbilane synthase
MSVSTTQPTPAAPAPLRLGTRGSELALWQSRHVAARLAELPGAPPVELVIIKTEGDRITDVPLSQVAGKAFFTKEIEEALLDGRIDLAVHSLKDLATEVPAGLAVGAVLEREDPRDVLIAPPGTTLDTLPAGARVGTSSLRRRALLAHWRRDLDLQELRGNVPTRIRKREEGVYEAIVLAAAGVRRLGLEAAIASYLPLDRVLPAVAQGAVAVELRSDDTRTAHWVGQLDHLPTRLATTAERAFLRHLEGGCQIPVGALATVTRDQLAIEGVVCALDGSRAIRGHLAGSAESAAALGRQLAEELVARGAGEILDAIRRQSSTHDPGAPETAGTRSSSVAPDGGVRS